MRIGLIDVNGHNFPNLPLMKISAWHKRQGDLVEWYEPLFHSLGDPFDIVYMSKVFSFTPDYEYYVNALKIVRGHWLLHRYYRWKRNIPQRTLYRIAV